MNFKQKFLLLGVMGFLYAPLLYLTYKYHIPDLAFTDFYFYYPLYEGMDISSTESPFNMRLLAPFFTWIFFKTGIHYHTRIAFQAEGINPDIFFCAILTNWLAVVLTAWMIFKELHHRKYPFYQCLLLALLYLFSFSTLLFCLNANTDGFSILLVLLAAIYYDRKSYLTILIFLLLVFQREFGLLIFLLLSAYDVLFKKEKYYLWQFFFSLMFLIIYYILRKTVFYTPLFAHQITTGSAFSALLANNLIFSEILMQVFMVQTVFWVYAALLYYSCKVSHHPFPKKDVAFIIFFLLFSFILGKMTLMNNNMGRFYHMFTPLLILRFIPALFPRKLS